MSADRLIAELWGEEPPRTAATALQGLVASLRKLLGRERVSTEGSGYCLRLGEEELDADRFEALLAGGDARAALDLWRGTALSDVADEPFAQAEIARLTELRLIAVERRLAADVDGEHTAHAVSELEALIAEHPYRAPPPSPCSCSRCTAAAGRQMRSPRTRPRVPSSSVSSASSPLLS